MFQDAKALLGDPHTGVIFREKGQVSNGFTHFFIPMPRLLLQKHTSLSNRYIHILINGGFRLHFTCLNGINLDLALIFPLFFDTILRTRYWTSTLLSIMCLFWVLLHLLQLFLNYFILDGFSKILFQFENLQFFVDFGFFNFEFLFR